MNEQHNKDEGRASSLLIKALAVIGLVAIVAVIAWVIVYGLRTVSQSSEGMEAAVTGVSSLFRTNDGTGLAFVLDQYTYPSGGEATVSWDYKGLSEEPQFFFSYECNPGVLFDVQMDTTWITLACDTPLLLTQESIKVRPVATRNAFNDVKLTITSEGDTATAVVGIVNTEIETDLDTESSNSSDTTTGTPATPSTPTPGTPVISTPTTPRTLAPADLTVSIESTGVLETILNRDTFFPLSPIPIDREAAVKFVVANVGDTVSAPWSFVANLPTENEETFTYVSALQSGLLPGAQVEFTLSFDNLIDASQGVIRVELLPQAVTDIRSNNVDSVTIRIAR